MLGLSKRLHDIVQQLRFDEISAAFQYRLIMSAVIVVGKSIIYREIIHQLDVVLTNHQQLSSPRLSLRLSHSEPV